MRLQHLHIRKPIPYITSLRLQEAVLEKHFVYKALLPRIDASPNPHNPLPPLPPPPQPTLLTFQTHPTYTVGRRHLTSNPLSAEQISFLTGSSEVTAGQGTGQAERNGAEGELATFFPSPRGGLLTYHAPGQLTAYVVLNLRAHNLTPRCYIRLLENTVIRTCARHGVPNATTTDDPGVWIAEPDARGATQTATAVQTGDETCPAGGSGPNNHASSTAAPDRKICAIGVHVSRGITSHGIGLNVFDSPIINGDGEGDATSALAGLYTLPEDSIYAPSPNQHQHQHSTLPPPPATHAAQNGKIPAPGYLSWGFSRIVACGLQGKSVTWLSRERARTRTSHEPDTDTDMDADTSAIDMVAHSLALELARSLNIDEPIVAVSPEDILSGA